MILGVFMSSLLYEKCQLCPRKCGVNRYSEKGFCNVPAALKAGRAALHFWEEPCISGTKGSGTVFFSGCTLRCCYCQNYKLSRGEEGFEISEESLAEVFLNLKKSGAHNINLVTAEQYAPTVREGVLKAKLRGLDIPVILNSSGYISGETLKIFEDVIDIYLTDFKYMDSKLAAKYSLAENYPTVAKDALEKMVSLKPEIIFDKNGILQSGVIVRHLCLPGHGEDTKKVIDYVFKQYGRSVILSIMSQYTPMESCKVKNLGRKLTQEEYDDIINYCIGLGIEDAYIQDGESAEESFIPSFDGNGIIF